MKIASLVPLVVLILSNGYTLGERAHRGPVQPPGSANPDVLICAPAPCVLPPTQASEGGGTVTDTPLVTNPGNADDLLLGSVDFNCGLGVHLSRDGGSTWDRVECMPLITDKKGRIWEPADEPAVGYDDKGTAYVAGLYFCAGYCYGYTAGFQAVQHSADGVHWSKPVLALRDPGQTFPFETSLTVDANAGSPYVNSVYVSGVMWSKQGYDNQVLVSHSSDGGMSWKQVAVERVRIYPREDRLTRTAVGKDGSVYITYLHCQQACRWAHLMASKSADGGDTWSTPQRIATIEMPLDWLLPHTKYRERVYNYPVIAADKSNGPYAGDLYVAMYDWTGTYLRVQVVRSTDGGKTWSKPVLLAPKSDTHDQFFPAISVSATGVVGVSWLDRRNDRANHDYQAFAAFSYDGGKSFGTNWQLTNAFSDPDIGGSNGFMGDYIGNTWRGDNVFVAAWMDSSNGVDMQEVVGGVRLR